MTSNVSLDCCISIIKPNVAHSHLKDEVLNQETPYLVRQCMPFALEKDQKFFIFTSIGESNE